MRSNILLSDGADFLNAFNHYQELVSYFPQIEPENEEIKKLYTEPYYKSQLVDKWNDIEIHIVNQTWGSTACGWGGMGGAAMTSKYNFIIKQKHTKLLFVYWDGKLAYIIHESEIKDYNRMPPRSYVNIIYRGK
jgi:hypothetical protein